MKSFIIQLIGYLVLYLIIQIKLKNFEKINNSFFFKKEIYSIYKIGYIYRNDKKIIDINIKTCL